MLIDLDFIIKGDRIIVISETTWEEYERILEKESPSLISYFNNCVTIVTPGRKHECIAETIRILIQAYCRKNNIPYFALGSRDLKKPHVVGKQPDAQYCFGTEKDIPDLAIEVAHSLPFDGSECATRRRRVNYSSGTLDDLEKYRLLGVPEVWMCQDKGASAEEASAVYAARNQLSFFVLQENKYSNCTFSLFLSQLRVDFLQPFVLRGLNEDNLTIENDFFASL